jgi:hypothetical protein
VGKPFVLPERTRAGRHRRLRLRADAPLPAAHLLGHVDLRVRVDSRSQEVADMTSLRRSIVYAGAACGVMDITAALVVYGSLGIRPMRLLQGVASGLLGPKSYEGGAATALLGLLCHFTVAFGAATVFVVASRKLAFLVRHAVPFGVLYGPVVYFFMQYVVVPLSAARRAPFSLKFMIIGLTIHVFCVGLPIALGNRFGVSAATRRPPRG